MAVVMMALLIEIISNDAADAAAADDASADGS